MAYDGVSSRIGSAILVTLPLLGGACSWKRFDDILDNSPVQILEAPGDFDGLGRSVAVMKRQDSELVLATGHEGYVLFEFAGRDLKSSDAVDRGSCQPSDQCWLAESVAPITPQVSSNGSSCVAFGIETKADEAPKALLYCDTDVVRAVSVPTPAPAALTGLTASSKAPRIVFASGPREAPDLLLAALPGNGAVWFYPTGNEAPIALTKPIQAGKSFGSSLSVVSSGSTRYLVVGEPDVANVYIYRTDGTASPDSSVCLTGATGFGTQVAAGRFVSDGSADLAATSNDEVVVIPALDGLTFTTDPEATCVPLSATNSVSLACSRLNAQSDCGVLLTSASLAASDLDGDGRDELLVGAPSASANGNDAAGKIYVTSFGPTKAKVLEELSASSVESGDRLGASIVGVPLSRPDVVLAGVPGGNKLAAFFCTSLLPNGEGGARCD